MKKKILSMAIIVVMAISSVSTKVQAFDCYASAKHCYVKGFSGGSYGSKLFTVKSGGDKYEVYKYSVNGRLYDCKKLVTDVLHHVKGRSGKTVGSAEAVSYSTTKTWNASIGCTYGVSGTISKAANMGIGVSSGWCMSKNVQKNISLIESEFKNAKTGDYATACSVRQYKMKVKKYDGKDLEYSKNFYMPYDETPQHLIVRSFDDMDTWELYD